MDNQISLKQPIIEVNFINNIIIQYGADLDEKTETITPVNEKKFEINPELKERFLNEYIGNLWHSEKDVLEYVIFYNNGECFCQRRKLKFNFETQSNFWTSYEFKGATLEQIEELKNKFVNLMGVETIIKDSIIESKIEKIDKEYLFYDQRYNKRVRERNAMLVSSDWRVLPDVVDTYPGEKDMWIKWRSELRNILIIHPSEFENSLELLKHLYNLRWPIDPKKYKTKYPNGEVEYLSTDDQWVERDVESSTDFVETKLRNVMELRQRYIQANRTVRKEVKELMKLLRAEDFVEAGIDYTKMYTEEELDDILGRSIEQPSDS